jgi:hypothetical protein
MIEARFMASYPDRRPDGTGLDDGPPLPPSMGGPRKRPPPKSPAQLAEIRARAWATRRARYGQAGHRGLGRGAYRQ